MTSALGSSAVLRTACSVACAVWVSACGGDVNLGKDTPDPYEGREEWGDGHDGSKDADTPPSPGETQVLYRGPRVVQTFTVEGGSLYALLRDDDLRSDPHEAFLVACSVDDCERDLRTIWRRASPNQHASRLFVSLPHAFWVDDSAGAIVGCSIEDCRDGPWALASVSSPSRLAADSEFVYWVEAGQTLSRVARTERVELPEPPQFPSSAGAGQVSLFDGAIYASFDGGRRIVRIESFGTPEETLYESALPVSSFDVGAGGLYTAEDVLTGRVLRCPRAEKCEEPEVLAENQPWPRAVLERAGSVYWVAAIGSESRLMKRAANGEVTELLRGVSQTIFDTFLHESGGYLYWSESAQDLSQIRRVRL